MKLTVCACFVLGQLPATIKATSQCSSSGMSFNGTLKNNQREIFFSFNSPRATRLAEMSNPALAKFRLCLNDVYLKHSPQRKSCGVHWVNVNSDELHLRFLN